MSGARRGSNSEPWNFEKIGIFGHFSTDVTFPIQYLMTTFSIQEWSKLTFARDIQTELNFDLLIQRDIDEDRAKTQISQYISPEKNVQRTDETVFLPPLLAAVVGSDTANKISEYYPAEKCAKVREGADEAIIRQWGDLFRIKHFEHDQGLPNSYELTLDFGEGPLSVHIDSSFAEMKFRLANSDEDPGARLVIIDGQHRLFALKHLKSICYDSVKQILLPVCILFPPRSTSESNEPNVPTVTKVLRDTFVHVNSTVEKVSGHFNILLSDSTIGSLICRAFCDEIVKDAGLGQKGLTLIEWNTKNHKESQTISKQYTITSIGPLFEVLEENFRNKRSETGLSLLKYLLNYDAIKDDIDFGLDDEGQRKPVPQEFPWRDFHFAHKEILNKAVRDQIVPCLKIIFFKIDCYDHIFKIFGSEISKLEIEKNETGRKGPIARKVYDIIMEYKPKGDDSDVGLRYVEFIESFEVSLKEKYSSIIRNNVFQKGLIYAWMSFLVCVKEFNFKPVTATEVFVELVNIALDKKHSTFTYDAEHTYLQDSVYDNTRIKPTKTTRYQISRLLLGYLGNNRIAKKLVDSLQIKEPGFEENEQLRDLLVELGVNNSSYFNGELLKLRRADFQRRWSTSTNLLPEKRKELEKAYDELQKAKKDKVEELPKTFDELVDKEISNDYITSVGQLDNVLGYSTTRQEFTEEIDD